MIGQLQQRRALLLCHDRIGQSNTGQWKRALGVLGAIAHTGAAPNTVEGIVSVLQRITMRMGAIVRAPAANQGVVVARVRAGALQRGGAAGGHGNKKVNSRAIGLVVGV